MQRDPTDETAATAPASSSSAEGTHDAVLLDPPDTLGSVSAAPLSTANAVLDGDASEQVTTLTNRRAPEQPEPHAPEVTPMRADERAGSNSLGQLDYPPPPPFQWQTPEPALPTPDRAVPAQSHRGQGVEPWGTTTITFSANTAAGASYLLWWISGLLVYFNERRNAYVRFHALQSVFFSAAATLFAALTSIVSALFLEAGQQRSSLTLITTGTVIAVLTVFVIVVCWSALVVAAWNGHLFHLPIVGRYAERYATPPTQQPVP